MSDSNSFWTAERVDQLKTLWAKGLSAGQIAVKLHVSRNAICGKIHRMGLTGRPKKSSFGQLRSSVRKSRIPRKSRAAPMPQVRPRMGFIEKFAADVLLQPMKTGKCASIMDLRDDSCRWPFGEVPPYTFCGGKTVEGYSYCPGHCRMAYGQNTNEKKAAA